MDEPTHAKAQLRFIVIGANHGRAYVAALRAAGHPVVGLASRGSASARAVAQALDLPYLRVDEIPPGLADVACLVTGDSLAARKTAVRALASGLDLVVEHPWTAASAEAILEAAARHRRRVFVNAYFPHLAPCRRFIVLANALSSDRPVAVVASCTRRTLYGLLEVVFRSLERRRPHDRTWALSTAPAGPQVALTLTCADISIVVSVERDLSPLDDGRDQTLPTHIMITDGLAAIHLPDVFVWPIASDTHAARGDRRDADPETVQALSDDPYGEANSHAITEIVESIARGASLAWQSPPRLVALARLWDAARAAIRDECRR